MARGGGVRVPVVALGLIAGGLWWWAVLRLLLAPDQSGLVEGAVAAGGWGLSLLPVHVTASRGGGGTVGRIGGGAAAEGPARVGGGSRHTGKASRSTWMRRLTQALQGPQVHGGSGLTRAWRRPRSGE
ncbi:hypothetical protein [Streptomyces sp. AM8-1-1]|uniref:hypothetical protein n=1 Tax=Streptomyces sp. AM8-1-1 TaxID=3075825 RepID=UPI0028C3F020|nr:hypothetical protein [Streptomyces sp. AM8-1-1]WNO71917.1 hypothetical protein RPQ07_09835 [Streptomyces sp. AM8-1-1]